MVQIKMKKEYLVNSAFGQYLPQAFVEQYDYREWHIKKRDYAIILDGPDNPDYWDTWNSIENYAFRIDEEGVRWTLCHDEDLWVVSEPMDNKFKFPLGTKFIPAGLRNKYVYTVVDHWTTYNCAGEIVKKRYVAVHQLMGQNVFENDVVETTIAKGLLPKFAHLLKD